MKPSMIFAIVMLTAIVLIVGFDLQLDPRAPIALADDMAARALYVCPAAHSTWDGLSTSMRMFTQHIFIGFFAAAIVLMFTWGWTLYQNLLEDKFKRTSFTKVWQITKLWFWGLIILIIAAATPNYFRRVTVDGASGTWVLCDNNTPGARAVPADKVHSR